MSDKDWLEHLKAGDKVIAVATGIGRTKTIRTVERVTT